MKNFLILALIISFSSFSFQFSAERINDFNKCLKAEYASEVTGYVLDLYYNKLTLASFIDSYFKWTGRLEIMMCLEKLGKPSEYLQFNSILSKIGYTLVFSSNCEKDIGPGLILLDNVLANIKNIKTEWKNLLINALGTGLLAKQSYTDCTSAINAIKDIWSH